jgi:preprotein translocase subunit SecY
MERITYIGASYLSFVILMPQWIMLSWHVPFMFGGASMLIVVVVLIYFINQVQSHVLSNRYDTLKKGKSGSKKHLGLLH